MQFVSDKKLVFMTEAQLDVPCTRQHEATYSAALSGLRQNSPPSDYQLSLSDVTSK